METSDKEIAAEIKARPENGFRLLFGKYGKPVYWHIRRLVVSHADAQDAAQETFVRVFRFFGNFRGRSLKPWIYSIATNEALRVISGRKDGQCGMEDSGASDFFADEYVDYGNAEAVRLQRAILSLPRKQQLAFNLRYYDDMTFPEIAKVMDSTAANAKANYLAELEAKVAAELGRLPAAASDHADCRSNGKRAVILSTVLAVAAATVLFVLTGLFRNTVFTNFNDVEKAFAQLDASDREYLLDVYENDMFFK